MRTIENLGDLLKYCPNSDNIEAGLAFRGQGKFHPLVPSLFRPGHACKNYGGWSSYEKMLIRVFEREARPYLDKLPQTLFDWIALAQHHGLPTRCLDWTTSPAIALFFAAEDRDEENDGIVWAYSSNLITFKLPTTWKDIAEFRDTTLWLPSKFFDRVTNQQGILTVHPLPEETAEFKPFEEGKETGSYPPLQRFVIPGKSKASILRQLDDIGVTHQFIYPGLDGVSRNIKWKLARLKAAHGDEQKHSISQKLI